MTKTEIINAAFRVWGRNFYRKTSLSQLAGELGVSKPALYRHFENKQALTDAMTESFLDDFTASVKPEFEKALLDKDPDNGISTIVRGISGFFADNVYALVFSLINIYDRSLDGKEIVEKLKSRGVDMAVLQLVIEKKYSGTPTVVRLVFATLTFLMSNFHKTKKSMQKQPSAEEKKNIIEAVHKTVINGLKLTTELNYEKLEKQAEEMPLDAEPEPFFKAVAEAVAEAGPWDVSMEMVAKRLGLSKSSLYVHFKNRKDMLRRLFVTEFKRIIDFARQGIALSSDTAEQLYLGIFSIAIYIRSRPEILIAMDWIRTRKLELGKPDKDLEIFRLFEDVDIEPPPYMIMHNSADEDRQRISHWILFLLINILTNPDGSEHKISYDTLKSGIDMQNNNLRVLYKYITSGLGG